MAKLEIEERAWSDPRLKRFCREAKIRQRHTAMGILCALWHDSQEELKFEATAEEIDSWLGYRGDRAHQIRFALCISGYIKNIITTPNKYRICGNERRLVIIKSRRLRARSSAETRWTKQQLAQEKRDTYIQNKQNSENAPSIKKDDIKHAPSIKKSTEKKCSKHKKSMPKKSRRVEEKMGRREDEESNIYPSGIEAKNLPQNCTDKIELFADENPDVIQNYNAPENSILAATIDFIEAPLPRVPKKKKNAQNQSSGANHVIAAYCTFYKQKFNRTPDIMGPEAAAAKRLSKELGVEKACKYVEGFLQMNDSWFIKSDYRMSILCQNVNKVGLYLDQGIAITSKVANQIETADNNQAVTSRVADRLREAGGDDW